MRRRDFFTEISAIGFSAGIFASCGSCYINNSKKNQIDSTVKRADYLKKIEDEICSVGPHPIGSPAFDKAAVIVKRELENSCPVVEIDEFKYNRWITSRDALFRCGSENIETCVSHYSPGTNNGGISGILKKVDYPERIIFGLTDKETGKYIAYVSISRHDLAVPIPFKAYIPDIPPLPSFNIGRKDLPLIEKAFNNGTDVWVKATNEFIPDTRAFSLIGTIPGKSDREILFLSHLDTVYNSPGALDNTASLIVMLMLAYEFSGKTHGKTLKFAATTGEEGGLLGSKNYAEKLKNKGVFKKLDYVVTFDSLTWGPNLEIHSRDNEVRKMFDNICLNVKPGGKPDIRDSEGFQLDGEPFKDSGAKGIYGNSNGYPLFINWHRPTDTPDKVPIDCVENSFLVFREFIKRALQTK